jgi:DNA-binding transcriptional LysR family regulator
MNMSSTHGLAESGGDAEFQQKATPALESLARFDLNLLVHLHALLDERSVTRAADRLGLTQSALSHSLKRCRRLMSDELLFRVDGGYALTPRARDVAPALHSVLVTVAREVVAPPVRSAAPPRLRVACSPGTAVAVLPRLARGLLAAGEDVLVVHVHPSTAGKGADFDVDIRWNEAGPGADAEVVASAEWALVAPPSSSSGTSESMSTTPALAIGSGYLDLLKHRLVPAWSTGLVVTAYADDEAVAAQMAAGLGAWAVMPAPVAAAVAPQRGLALLPLPVSAPQVPAWMSWGAGIRDSRHRDRLRGLVSAARVGSTSPAEQA